MINENTIEHLRKLQVKQKIGQTISYMTCTKWHLKSYKTQGPAAGLELANYLARGAEYGGLSQYDALTLAGISGARANGGPVMSGGTYLVGERGPELFTPGSSGSITPNGAMGGNTITVNVNGGDPNSIVRALQDYVRQSGPVPLNTRAM